MKKQPLVLLHGALGSHHQLQPLANLLSDKFTVINHCFIGHDGNGLPEGHFSFESFIENIESCCSKIDNYPVNIFGYSMGGYAALCYANKYPEKVGRIMTLGTKFNWDDGSVSKELKMLDPEKTAEKVPQFAAILDKQYAPDDWKAVMQKTAGMMQDLSLDPILQPKVLNSIQHVTKILLGDEDKMADKASSLLASETLPNGSFQLLLNTPHPFNKVDLEMLTKEINLFFS